ncbi:hypothetical protein JGG36_24470, partial [Salmonella enterica subsp. enterica serovar Meleagridis]|nr:hypothetical protein [Salmonella enterica subsp. enterica serovar Meleagridis]
MKSRLQVSTSLLARDRNAPFLKRVVTCDEKWILYDNRRRSAQWLDDAEAPKHLPKPTLHPKKIMVIVWWCATGIIHYLFLKCGETITAEKYCTQLDEMHEKLRVQRPIWLTEKKFYCFMT